MQEPPAPARTARSALLVLAWVGLLAGGFAVLWSYASTPGPSEAARATAWPGDSGLPLPRGRPALLLFVHPECPCSRATVSELERVIAKARDAFDVRVLLVVPKGSASSSSLRESAERIPGVRSLEDPGGIEAARFGARTSGTVAVYDVRGERLFFGGITGARGHEGHNPGAAALLSLARGREAAGAETPVFGCGLVSPGDPPVAAAKEPASRAR